MAQDIQDVEKQMAELFPPKGMEELKNATHELEKRRLEMFEASMIPAELLKDK